MSEREPIQPPPGVVIDGIKFPGIHPFSVPWDQLINDIRNMTARNDDIFLCAYPKAGTHWLWEVMYMLRVGKAEYEPRAKEHLMMEFSTIERLDAEPSPRIFNTHLPFTMLPVQQIRGKRAKILHLYRNPKDTVVSMWFHYKQFPEMADVALRDFIQLYLKGQLIFGTWAAFLVQLQKFVRDNPDIHVFNVSFEETKRNPAETIKRLARFLELTADDELCENIAEACSFQNMKKNSDLKTLVESTVFPLDQKMYRKGEVGDWKNYLTVAESEEIDRALAEDIKECDMFKLEYTP